MFSNAFSFNGSNGTDFLSFQQDTSSELRSVKSNQNEDSDDKIEDSIPAQHNSFMDKLKLKSTKSSISDDRVKHRDFLKQALLDFFRCPAWEWKERQRLRIWRKGCLQTGRWSINISRKLKGKDKQCNFSTSSVELAYLIHSHSPALLEQVQAVSNM